MRFTVLSHAGLAVEGAGATLLIDPWLVGSCYWRSWWNYPPVDAAALARLRPDFIYITHLHWDHFHGPSLRRFAPTTPIFVPRGHFDRLRRDLGYLGFGDVRELDHGQRVKLRPGFFITSYQMFPFLDSALVVEEGGVTLFNVNDAKFMGGPLDQILREHPRIDFVFRSHSSANGRVCYDVVDGGGEPTDDPDAYLASFAAFVRHTGARYAIPFASNHCFLHKDVEALNGTIQTPLHVERYFRERGIEWPELRVMVSGDAWSSEEGFVLRPDRRRYLEQRTAEIAAYKDAQRGTLEASYATEDAARITREEMEAYFQRLTAALPWPVRIYFRGKPIAFVLHAGRQSWIFEVDLFAGRVREIATKDYHPDAPREVRTSVYIIKQCIEMDMFAHVPTSKRVQYRVNKQTQRDIALLNLLFLLHETEYLPLRRIFTRRALRTWTLRWRELLLYAHVSFDLLRGRGFSQERYIGPPREGAPPPVRRATGLADTGMVTGSEAGLSDGAHLERSGEG